MNAHPDDVMKTSFEYACEYVDQYGDIQENDFSGKLAEVYPPRLTALFKDCYARVCIIRNTGSVARGLVDKAYAYAGETEFCSGHKVPKVKFNQLLKTI
tara:strand:- start:1007 stop:1303 length:297 start_codon:yes stop_codon:yes gene_type:complete